MKEAGGCPLKLGVGLSGNVEPGGTDARKLNEESFPFPTQRTSRCVATHQGGYSRTAEAPGISSGD
jgi:hypothetical protein